MMERAWALSSSGAAASPSCAGARGGRGGAHVRAAAASFARAGEFRLVGLAPAALGLEELVKHGPQGGILKGPCPRHPGLPGLRLLQVPEVVLAVLELQVCELLVEQALLLLLLPLPPALGPPPVVLLLLLGRVAGRRPQHCHGRQAVGALAALLQGADAGGLRVVVAGRGVGRQVHEVVL